MITSFVGMFKPRKLLPKSLRKKLWFANLQIRLRNSFVTTSWVLATSIKDSSAAFIKDFTRKKIFHCVIFLFKGFLIYHFSHLLSSWKIFFQNMFSLCTVDTLYLSGMFNSLTGIFSKIDVTIMSPMSNLFDHPIEQFIYHHIQPTHGNLLIR